MKRFLTVMIVFSFLAFGGSVQISEQPSPPATTTSQNANPNSQCPTQDAIKGYLVSQNLATYTILGIVPSKAVPGYCDVILKNIDNKMFFMRIRNDMAYLIVGNVVNAATNEIQKPDMSSFGSPPGSQNPTTPSEPPSK
jgi:hypothetical protein